MKCMIGVLAVASLVLAEPEADPLHYYAPYSYPYFYRPYYASGYAGPLPGASYQSVHRLHKREAEADPQLLAVAAPYVNDGPVAGPLTAAFGDLVATERGLRPISLEGFSEDVNQDGFVDPLAQAVPVAAPVFSAPFAPLRTVAPAPVAAVAPAPVAPLTFASAPVAPLPLAQAPLALPVASAVHHAPVVKTVVETPATVATVAHAAPLVHSVVGLTSHDCVTPHGCAVRAALLAGTPSATFGHVTSTRIAKREAEPEAEAEAEAEADADAFYGFHYGYNYAPYSAYTGYSGYYPYAHPFGYNYFNGYYGLPYTAPVAPVAPVAAPAAPLVKTVTRPVTYTHIGAHPVNPTTVLETETFI